MIRVDGVTYTWMGAPGPQAVTQKAFTYTATSSQFTMDVGGKVEMNITFTSPITPNDMKRQSLLFSYLQAQVYSIDGAKHSVQLYTDISAGKFSYLIPYRQTSQLIGKPEWVAGDHNSVAEWNYGVTSDNVAYHRVARQTQLDFSETSDQADFGNWYYSTLNRANLAYQSGSDTAVRGQFQSTGKLANTKDTNYRPINQQYPVFGFSNDFGSIQGETHSIVYTIGLTQKQAIQYDGANGVVPLPSLWTSYFGSEEEAVSDESQKPCFFWLIEQGWILL
jgi:hypothetical protein